MPANGATDVPVSNTTFTWPVVADATSYQFAIADGSANTPSAPFAILDYSANTVTNAEVLQETLKYNNTYYWEVRAITATSQSAWTVLMFTTEQAPVATHYYVSTACGDTDHYYHYPDPTGSYTCRQRAGHNEQHSSYS